MRDLLILVLTVLFAVVALRKPMVGVLVYVGFSILGPQSYAWGIGRTFSHSQIIGVATIVGYFFSSEQKRLPLKREARLILALWVLFAVSTCFALYPELAVDKLIFVSKVLFMVFLCTAIVNTQERLHALVLTVALSLGFYGAKLGFFVLATGFQQKAFGPEGTYLFQENAIGIALAANLALLAYLFRVERARWLRWAVTCMMFLTYPAVIGTFSRGAWLSLAASSFLLLLNSRRKIVAILLILGLVAGVVVAGGLIVSDRLVARWNDLVNWQEDGSAQSRFWNWEFGLRVGLARPLGGGFELYSIEAYEQYFPEFLVQWPGKVWVCHSMWMEVMAEHGVLGFLLWISLMVSCLLSLRRLRLVAKHQRTQARVGELASMLVVAFASFIIGGTFLDVAYHELIWQLITMVIVAKNVWRQGTQAAMQGFNQALVSPVGAIKQEQSV
jgi:probable O-glycosylation ligase (exosortase A-associated)